MKLNVRKLVVFEMMALLIGFIVGQVLFILIYKSVNPIMLAFMFAESIGILISADELNIFTKKEN